MSGFCGRLGADGLRVLVPAGCDGRAGAQAGCAVLFSGYLANAQTLREELGLGGGADEAAVAAHAYRRWGEDVQQRLLGEYALVLFDPHARSALLTHDAVGLAPLFYEERAGELLFATDLLDLIGLLADDRLDAEYFADYLATGYITGARTPFAAVKRLVPGTTLRWSPAGSALRRTWDLADAGPPSRLSQRENEARLRELLTAAVRSSLGAHGQTWIALSGGLDSSTVACLAARERSTGIGAFSLVVPEYPDANEEPFMREVIAHTGMAWHALDTGTVLPFSALPDAFMAEPTAAVATAAMRKRRDALFARHGVTTLLNGNGGDMILGALPGPVPAHLADPLFRGDLAGTVRGVRAWSRGSDQQRSAAYWATRAVLAPALDHLRGRHIASNVQLALPPWLDASYAARMRIAERERRRIATRCATPGAQQVWDTVWVGALSAAARASTDYVVRSPLYSRPLIEFMQTVPWEQRLRPLCDRYLQRRALKGILPERVRRRAWKAMGTYPFVEGLRRSRDWMSLLCDDPRIVALGFTSRAAWREGVQQAALGQTYGDRYFLTAVAIEVWLQGLEEFRRARRPRALAMEAA